MEGTRVSHYDILERLGGGGMGVVYKALDTKLNRHVALKFLPPELTRDDEARTRFVQEAQAASALDHPNICTIHEIDSTPEGQMFIAMAFYDGETLKKRIDCGRLPVEEALDLGMQIAQGLTKAHAAGIVHRDIKPANVMITKDGFVKIVDFGIAKLLGVTGPTQVGSTIGTVSYMSPEQVAGDDADPRSDVWALGAVLYEMLTGQLPFKGENQWAVMNAIANREPEGPRAIRTEVSEDVDRVVMAALEKEPEKRTASTEELRRGLEECRARPEHPDLAATPPPAPSRAFLRPAVAVPVLALGLALAWWSVSSAGQGADERRAREEGLPELLSLVNQDQYQAAFALARELETIIPNDPLLAEAAAASSITGAIVTEPAGAEIFVRAYGAADAEWEHLGTSPLAAVRLPRWGSVELRAELPGFEPRLVATGVPGLYFGRANSVGITLVEAGAVPAEMVYVPGGAYPLGITGANLAERVDLDPFLIDRYEVTNAEFSEFVEAGGYERPEFWEGLEFVHEGATLSWAEAVVQFVDATGRPGPSTWELGEFPRGLDAHPVGGVSWYEAVAYARFRGKELPTLYHWSQTSFERGPSLASATVPIANFGNEGPSEVGASRAMGPQGTFDTAGNVREWTWNASGDHRWLPGGAWNDDPYMASLRFTAPPFDRSAENGFRTARYLGREPREELVAPVELFVRDYRAEEVVPDEVFEIYRRQMTYVPSELDPAVEGDEIRTDYWIREHVSLNAGHSDSRLSVYVFLPTSATPPHQTLIYFYGMGAFMTAGQSSDVIRPGSGGWLEGIVRSGRAVVVPVWNGSFERWDDFLLRTGDEGDRVMRTRMTEWAAELGQTIDYLSARGDIDADKIAYLGVSFGTSAGLPLLTLEPRLEAALLLLAGFSAMDYPPETFAVNHAPRVTMPVLMIGGEYDYVFPKEVSQEPLFEALGTAPEDKRHLIYEMGHGPIPAGQTLRDVLPWLDEYLGPVN